MSVDASIDIKFSKSLHENISPIKIIRMLLDYGWTFNDYGKVSYLPVGDNDDYDWQREEMSTETLIDILMIKEHNHEDVVVTMTWQDTNIGGIFSFRKNGHLSINLVMNRKMYSDGNSIEMTDVNWYLSKLLPVLNQKDLRVEHFAYEEHV
jgi:hypothetical protein